MPSHRHKGTLPAMYFRRKSQKSILHGDSFSLRKVTLCFKALFLSQIKADERHASRNELSESYRSALIAL